MKNEGIADKLIELTQKGKITWDYLDENKALYSSLQIKPAEKKATPYDLVIKNIRDGITTFDTDNSFITEINDNYIVLYSLTNSENKILIERIKLLLVPRTFKEIEEIKCDEEIIKLHAVVKSAFPNAGDIIKDLFQL